MQESLTESLFQGKRSARSASCGQLVLRALLISLGFAFVVTQMPWARSAGVKFVSSRSSPLNMALSSTAHYNSYVGPAVSQQDMDTAMSYYGSSRHSAYPSTHWQSSRRHDYRYLDYPNSRMSYRHQDYRYHPGHYQDYRYQDYRRRGHFGHGDEITFGPQGEAHLASFRYRPGESDIWYGGRNYNMYRGGYNDRYGGGHYDRYRGVYGGAYGGGYYNRYRGGYGGAYGGGYYDRYPRYGYIGSMADDNNWRSHPYR